MARDQSNLRAGLFVLLGVTLGFLAIVMLADFGAWFTPMQRVQVRFALGDGVAGLKPGAAVTIGDHEIGNVVDIQPHRGDDGRVTGLLVEARVPSEFTLYENARIILVVPPLGSGSRLDIVSVGGPRGGAADADARAWVYDAEEDPPLEGGTSPSQFASDFAEEAGIGAAQRAQVQAIIRNVQHLTEAIAGDMPEDRLTERARRLSRTLASLNQASDRIAALGEALAGDRPVEELPDRAAEVAAVVKELGPTLRGVQRTLDEAKRLLADNRPRIDEALQGIASLVEDNAPVLRDAIAAGRDAFVNAEEITAAIREKTITRLDSVLAKADDAMGDVRSSMAELEEMVVAQRPVMEKTIANLRLASDQFKLASIEIRRAPWRLLYEPKEKELETENLYDSARSFALAASNLESTASSMQAMLDKYGDKIDPDDARLKLMLENMHRSFEKFSEVQDQFWQALEDRSGDARPRSGR